MTLYNYWIEKTYFVGFESKILKTKVVNFYFYLPKYSAIDTREKSKLDRIKMQIEKRKIK